MRKLALLLTVSLLTLPLQAAEEVLKEISWEKLAPEARPKTAELVKDEKLNASVLKLQNTEAKGATYNLATIENPGITRTSYAVSGEVRYDDVAGKGYLEMWSQFPDGSAFFSRTLGETGPMQFISGSSGRRPFSLPFNAAGAKGNPSKLVINLVLPGKGTVWISDMKLIQNDAAPLIKGAIAAPVWEWWSSPMGGFVGGLLGVIGGLLGALAGLLTSSGKNRALALAALKGAASLGMVALLAAMIALATSQPFHVYYPLLLCGALLGTLPLLMTPMIKRRYEQLELRRIQAQDA
ncbi:MAG TPA: hypothetical protein VGP72_00110 [Planctomycetota bacterium]|jgi:hypothetical protein